MVGFYICLDNGQRKVLWDIRKKVKKRIKQDKYDVQQNHIINRKKSKTSKEIRFEIEKRNEKENSK